MKKYKVCGFFEMNTNDAEQARALFKAMINNNNYWCGYMVDNDTGEVYCHFDKEADGNGIKTTSWTAFE
jgi:hypothetical protein